MKNNKGFIAISLIYSFFLVFLMSLLAIVANYAHNRILLNDVKKTTQEKLNGLSEFNPISLENTSYQKGDEVFYASDTWIVLSDNGPDVTLILKRSLTEDEIDAGLGTTYAGARKTNTNTLNMCLSEYNSAVCCYEGSNLTEYNLYYWDDSLAKIVVDQWLLNNALLQKAISRGTLVEMTFKDGTAIGELEVEYSSYIRIPIKGEYNNSNIWTLTYEKEDSKKSYVYVYETGVVAHETYKEIKPIIQVKKATT